MTRTTTRPIVSRAAIASQRGGQVGERHFAVDDRTDVAAVDQRKQLGVQSLAVRVRGEVEPAGQRFERDRVVDVRVADTHE